MPTPATIQRVRKPRTAPAGEQGAVLVIGLLILVMVSAVAVSGMMSANRETTMSANDESLQQALAVAENAVLAGEQDIRSNFTGAPAWDWSESPDPAMDGRSADGYYEAGQITSVIAHGWDAAGGEGVETPANGGRYVIEYIGFAAAPGSRGFSATDRRFLYRVTGRGTGSRGGERLVQSIFATSN